jgi:low temperature requirement protein LtrA
MSMTMAGETTESRAVSPLELFYDLVFVFAISQLSQHLLDDLSWRGAAQTLVLLCAVFTVWIHTSFEATFFDITRRQTQLAVLTAMALGLFMNAAIGTAFSTGGWAFALPLVLTQVVRGIVTATRAPTPALREHYVGCSGGCSPRPRSGWAARSPNPVGGCGGGVRRS